MAQTRGTFAELYELQWGRGFAAAEVRDNLRLMDALERLQWGRGFAAAEVPPKRALLIHPPLASMGPRLRSRGSLESAPIDMPSNQLQWGRGFAAAEVAYVGGTTANGTALQWGRGFAAAEVRIVSKFAVVGSVLQWGRGVAAAEVR